MPDIGKNAPVMSAPRFHSTVVALAYDRLCTFEFGCVHEVFGLPRPELDRPWYRFRVHAVEPGPLSAAGELAVRAPFDPGQIDEADTVIGPGWRAPEEPFPPAVCTAPRVAELLVWLARHLHEPVSVDDMARRVGMGSRTVQRRLRASVGATPADWLVRQRAPTPASPRKPPTPASSRSLPPRDSERPRPCAITSTAWWARRRHATGAASTGPALRAAGRDSRKSSTAGNENAGCR